MYIQVEVFNSTPTQTRGFYANVVIPSFFFHFTSVFAARRRNTKNNGSTFRETNSTSGAWLARKSKLNLQFVFAPLACVLSALLALFCFVLFCFVLFCFRFRFRFRFNYLGIDNKILDAKFFVRSYNLQHVLFVFLFDSLTSENKCTRTGHEWRTQWRRGWGGGFEHKELVSSHFYKVWLPK